MFEHSVAVAVSWLIKHQRGDISVTAQSIDALENLSLSYDLMLHGLKVMSTYYPDQAASIISKMRSTLEEIDSKIRSGAYDWALGSAAPAGPLTLSFIPENDLLGADSGRLSLWLFRKRFRTAKPGLYAAPLSLTEALAERRSRMRWNLDGSRASVVSDYTPLPEDPTVLEAALVLWDADPSSVYHDLKAAVTAAGQI